jgi:hypothetical protein
VLTLLWSGGTRSPAPGPPAAYLLLGGKARARSQFPTLCYRSSTSYHICERSAWFLYEGIFSIFANVFSPSVPGAAVRPHPRQGARGSFLCLITPLCSYLYGGLYGGLYERAHIIRYFPIFPRQGARGRRQPPRRARAPAPRARALGCARSAGINPIATLEEQRLNMIGNRVYRRLPTIGCLRQVAYDTQPGPGIDIERGWAALRSDDNRI